MLVYATEQLGAELPPGLHARVDERLAIDVGEDKPRQYLPDVALTEPWDRSAAPVLGLGGATMAAAEPEIVDLSEVKLRHVEIVDSREHVITAIEALSPTNKESAERRDDWSSKRGHYLRGAINLPQVVDASVRLRGGARPDEVRDRDRRQQADDGHHDHDFHQREAGLALCPDSHTIL